MFATVHLCSVISTLLFQLVLSNSLLDVSRQGGDHHSGSEQFTTSNQQIRPLLPTEIFMANSKTPKPSKSTVNVTKLAPIQRTTAGKQHWVEGSVEGDFNRDYFHQMNALNHKPLQELDMQQSHPKPSISAPASSESHGRSQNNIFYYSPSSYGQSSLGDASPKNSNSQLASYLSRFNMTQNYWPSAPSNVKAGSLHSENTDDSEEKSGQVSGKSVQWSIPVGQDKLGQNVRKATNRVDYPNSYSGELNKLLLQKYYNRDLSQMSALIDKHASDMSTNTDNVKKQTLDLSADNPNDDQDEESDDEEDADEENAEKPMDGVSVVKPLTASTLNAEPEYPKSGKVNLVGEYKGRSGETVLRVHSPRVVRPFASRSMPVRLQAAHSHSMPHYYIPHGIESGSHHHLVSEKSSTWLGSGLAAGILIGAIPFGIMMASMMPTLLTTAMPIVNTATVAGRRRRRRSASQIKNLFMEQTLETMSAFLRKGVEELVTSLQESNKYSVKKDVHEYSENPNDVLKTVARYAIAAVDEPKCIKEMVCALVAGGRHSQTSPLQKTLYVMTKW